MPIPTFDQFIEPVLRHLAAHPEGSRARDVYEAAADTLHLSEADRQILLPSGAQAIYKNRIGWAHDRLKRASYSTSPRWGHWQLTPTGQQFAQAHPGSLPPELLHQLAFNPKNPKIRNNTPEPASNQDPDPLHTSPDDRLESALSEIRESVAADLLTTLSQTSPKYFETIVLDLLHKLGYGTSRTDLRRVGGPGDSGIDGVISLDKLGLEKVYVQAKRWQNTIGRPQVQEFYGALAGQKATKGVFITTSRFTPQAVDFANSVERIVLVDGDRLTKLMIDHEVGVTLRPLWIPKLDSDYFEE